MESHGFFRICMYRSRGPMASAQRPTLGSLRVSTATQDLEKDTAALLSLANDRHLGKAPCMEETGSGRSSWRQRQLAEVLDHAYKGDTSLSSDLSRLGRSMLECMEILSIAVARGSTISAVKGGWTLERSRQSKILAMAFAMAAASARELISPRTTEALRVKQARYLPPGNRGAARAWLNPEVYRPARPDDGGESAPWAEATWDSEIPDRGPEGRNKAWSRHSAGRMYGPLLE